MSEGEDWGERWRGEREGETKDEDEEKEEGRWWCSSSKMKTQHRKKMKIKRHDFKVRKCQWVREGWI